MAKKVWSDPLHGYDVIIALFPGDTEHHDQFGDLGSGDILNDRDIHDPHGHCLVLWGYKDGAEAGPAKWMLFFIYEDHNS